MAVLLSGGRVPEVGLSHVAAGLSRSFEEGRRVLLVRASQRLHFISNVDGLFLYITFKMKEPFKLAGFEGLFWFKRLGEA